MGGIRIILVPTEEEVNCRVCTKVQNIIGWKLAAVYPGAGLTAGRIARLLGERLDSRITPGRPWGILSRDAPDPDEVLRLVIERIGVLGETELGYKFLVLIAEPEMVKVLEHTLRALDPTVLDSEPTPRPPKPQTAWMT